MLKPHTIRFRVTDKEFAALTIIAESLGHTVSQVVRDKLFTQDAQRSHAGAGAGGNRRSARGKAQEANSHAIVAPGRSVSQMTEVKMAPAAEGRCAHGKRAGEVCYKCDPKMGYPGLL